ncbi:hypothetical protein D3C81_998080 [compost metagenome]
MAEQIAAANLRIPAAEVIAVFAVFAGTLVLQTDAAKLVGHGEQEVVVVVVLGAKQFACLCDQRAMLIEVLGLGFQILGAVGEYVQAHRARARGCKVDRAVIAPGEHRGIHQDFQIGRRVMHGVAFAARHGQRAGRFPALRVACTGLVGDGMRGMPGRVQHHRIPLQVEHVRRHHRAALCRIGGTEELVFHAQLGCAVGHLHVEGVDIERVAHPRQALAVGGDDQAGQFLDLAGRRMAARQPRRVMETLQSAAYRHRLPHLEHALAQVGGIHVQDNRARIGRFADRNAARVHVRHIRCRIRHAHGSHQCKTQHRRTEYMHHQPRLCQRGP